MLYNAKPAMLLTKIQINMKFKNLHFAVFVFTTCSFQLLTQGVLAQVCFSPATNFAVSNNPKSFISADFNNDNYPDLAIVENNNNVTIKLGDGTGGFGLATSFTVGNYPISIISADFNGDGNVDLVTANWGGSVSVLLGDGTGNFSASNNITTGYASFSIVSGDYNGDSISDLAVGNFGGISIMLGDGTGNFVPTNPFYTSYYAYSLTSADFNGDGKADLAGANGDYVGYVSVFLGDGAGGFGAATSFSVGNHPLSIIKSDFNGDGETDLAVVDSGSSQVSILIGTGTGNFSPASNFPVDFNPKSITCADFNGDGNADLAAANYNNISILLGDGLGGFSIAANFPAGSNGESIIISADFNGDGKPDLATSNNYSNNISLLVSSPPPIVTASSSSDTVCAGASLTLTGNGASSYTWTLGITNGVAFTSPIVNSETTITYTVTGTIAGCTNIATKNITINPLPAATFTTENESSSLYCDGSIIANLTGGTGTIQAQWLNSGQTVLSSTNSVGSLCPGTYTLNLIDSNLCTKTYTQAIQAGSIPPNVSICLVTVDSTNTHNLVVWEKTNIDMAPIDSFVVYREIGTNYYQQIGAVSNSSLSTFDDLIANPASTGYRYKLKSKNAHGVESLFSNFHNTIYLTNTGGNFSWTPYQVENNSTPVYTYNIFRDDNSTGNFQNIGFTSGNQFGYTDVNFASYPNASYYVEAVMMAGVCNPTRSGYTASRSNVKYFGNAGVQQLNNNKALGIYPNPADNIISITGIKGKTTLQLYDVVGKLVLEKEENINTIISTSQLVNGIYTLLAENETGRTFNKVVISH